MTVEFLTIKRTELANVVVVATKRTNPNRRRAILFCSGKEMGQQTNTKPRTWHDFWIWRQADKVVCRMPPLQSSYCIRGWRTLLPLRHP